MTTEFHAHREQVAGSSDRSFGLTVGGVLLLLAGWRWWRDGHGLDAPGWTLAVAGCVLVLLGLVAPNSLRHLNRAWTRLGLLLSKVVSPVVMALLFALAVVPVTLIRRALGHDPLRLRRDPKAASYWIERTPPGPAPATMTDQF